MGKERIKAEITRKRRGRGIEQRKEKTWKVEGKLRCRGKGKEGVGIISWQMEMKVEAEVGQEGEQIKLGRRREWGVEDKRRKRRRWEREERKGI